MNVVLLVTCVFQLKVRAVDAPFRVHNHLGNLFGVQFEHDPVNVLKKLERWYQNNILYVQYCLSILVSFALRFRRPTHINEHVRSVVLVVQVQYFAVPFLVRFCAQPVEMVMFGMVGKGRFVQSV